jgi:hypothetical protein
MTKTKAYRSLATLHRQHIGGEHVLRVVLVELGRMAGIWATTFLERADHLLL